MPSSSGIRRVVEEMRCYLQEDANVEKGDKFQDSFSLGLKMYLEGKGLSV